MAITSYTQEEAQLAQTAKSNWYDRARFEAEILPKFRAWEIDIEGNIQEAPVKPKSMADVYKSTLWKGVEAMKGLAKWYGEVVQWLPTGVARAVGSTARVVWGALDVTLGKIPEAIVPWYKSDFGKSMQQMAEVPARAIESIWAKAWLNAESIPSKVGQFAGGAIATAPVGEWLLAWAGKLVAPLAKPLTRLVKSDDIIANILQPSAWQAKLFPKAKEWFKYVLKYAPPSVQKKLANVKTFSQLEWVFDDTANSIYKEKVLPVLAKSTSRVKNANIDDALRGLQEAYTNVVGDEARAVQETLKGLIKLNKWKGLSAQEITKLKTLHTNANQIFTQKWVEKAWFNVDQLDDVRSALKTLTEKLVKKDTGVDISKANARYWALQSVKNLIREQIQGATSTAWRATTPWRAGALVEKVTELPWVQQAIDVADVIVKKSPLKMLRSGKINPAEVEKQLPQFMKRLIDQIQKETTVKWVVKNQGKVRKWAKYLLSWVTNTINKAIQQ